jgi:hypothetical protein
VFFCFETKKKTVKNQNKKQRHITQKEEANKQMSLESWMSFIGV